METLKKRENIFNARAIAQVGVMSAAATILMAFEFPLPFAPSFYKIDLSEVPVLIASFAIGPMAGVFTEMIKILLHMLLQGTSTAGVGDFANFIFGCAFVVPAAVLYKSGKTRKHALVGMVIGTVLMTIIAGFVNAYVLLPVYAAAFHMPMTTIVSFGTQVNPAITSVTTLVLFAVVPFNLLKGFVVSIVTFILYKKVSPILHKRK